jgi:hypothetical protein
MVHMKKTKRSKSTSADVSSLPGRRKPRKTIPDFLARMRKIYGDKVLAVSGAELLSADRDRY